MKPALDGATRMEVRDLLGISSWDRKGAKFFEAVEFDLDVVRALKPRFESALVADNKPIADVRRLRRTTTAMAMALQSVERGFYPVLGIFLENPKVADSPRNGADFLGKLLAQVRLLQGGLERINNCLKRGGDRASAFLWYPLLDGIVGAYIDHIGCPSTRFADGRFEAAIKILLATVVEPPPDLGAQIQKAISRKHGREFDLSASAEDFNRVVH